MTALQAMPDVLTVKRIQTSYTNSNNQNFTKKSQLSKKHKKTNN